jgi:uncharacterized protein YciW
MSDEEKPPTPRGMDDVMMPEPFRYLFQMMKQQAERSDALEAETQKKFDFIIEQQAQLTATVGKMAEKVDRTAGSITNLLAVAELQAGEIKDLTDSMKIVDERTRAAADSGRQTDERLNALIGVVERLISDRRNGG